jgi:transposase
MYIRRSTRIYKGKTFTNYVLVESVHTAKGPRQRSICSLGDLGPRPREEWLKLARKIEDALVGQADLLEINDPEVSDIVGQVRARQHAKERAPKRPSEDALIGVDATRVTTERHREAGPVHVGHQFWQRLGLDSILEKLGLTQTVAQLACAMTLNRLIAPASEHAMPDWIRSTALDDILGVDFDTLEEDPLYRVLDKLHPHRFAIETALVSRQRSLFNLDASIYLYDLSSTYFEGVCAANEKAKRGYSRDHRPDCKQVVVGLVVNRDGFPITHEIFAGNTQDRSTLVTMLDRLRERVGLSEGATVVLDRGMAYDENLDELKRRKLHFVVASRQPERNRWLADFEDTEGFTAVVRQPSPRNPAQKKTTIEVKTYTQAQLTYVLCRSEQRIAKDLAIRSKHEKRMQADIDKLSKRIADGKLTQRDKINQAIGRLQERYPRVARYFEVTYDPETQTLLSEFNADKQGKAAQLDGCYLLKTSRTDLSGDELWRIYSLLTRAEDAFRDMKTPLAERPIFHQLERRVDSHIFLCVLAYHLLAAIEQTLLDQSVHTSWASVRNTLKTHQICTIVLPTKGDRCLRIRKAAIPDADVKDLYRRLAVSPHIINPIHIWSEPANSD